MFPRQVHTILVLIAFSNNEGSDESMQRHGRIIVYSARIHNDILEVKRVTPYKSGVLFRT